MEEKFLFCVCVTAGDHKVYGPEWKEAEHGKTLIDLFVQACGNKILGQQVQVLVSKDRSFLEAAVVQVCTPLSTLTENCQSYIQFILKAETFKSLFDQKYEQVFMQEKDCSKKIDLISAYTHIKPSVLTNWKNQFNSTYEPFRENLAPPSPKEVWNEQVAIHNLTTCSSFENMTVQEICDEICRIKTTEKLKNKAPLQTLGHSNELEVRCDNQSNDCDLIKNNSPSTIEKSAVKCVEKISNKSPLTNTSKQNVKSCVSKSLSPRQPISDRLSLLAQPRRRLFNEKESDNKTRRKSLSSSKESTIPAINDLFNVASKSKKSDKSSNRRSTVNSTFIRELSPQGNESTAKDYIKKTFLNQKGKSVKNNVNSLTKNLSLTELDKDILYSNIHNPHSKEEKCKNNYHNSNIKDTLDSDVNLIDFNNTPSNKTVFQPKQYSSSETTSSSEKAFTQNSLKKTCSSPSLLESISMEKESSSLTPDLLDFIGCQESLNESNKNVDELVWSNFRGIKFTKSDDLNATFILDREKELADHNILKVSDPNISQLSDHSNSKISDRVISKISDHNVSLEEKDSCLTTKHKSITLPHNHQMSSSLSSAFDKTQCHNPETTKNNEIELSIDLKNAALDEAKNQKTKEFAKTPEKTRKHWGINVEGIDNIVVSSLQAFSNELRATTEIVANNIRSLYEDWRLKNEGETITDELQSLILKKTSKNSDTNAKQVGIAAVFGNLRKIDIKLKTIELATRAMFQQLEEEKSSEKKVEKEVSKMKSSISRSKSFKWRELKKNVRNKSSSQPWSDEKCSETHNSSSDSDS
ncbi:uncharacterized protein LOC101240441 isoform X1 [Hydra vulgaris]|uniref:uncharacterized protein LOC101240441 isoform X1 n=1 Tax=Hydra vulgaris TaxID=6087 RepID=UPI001F5E7890|nr:uncharacterized protein LOC101240441 isoform X1 [Hydra vulgaris]